MDLLRPCNAPGCTCLVESGRCSKHKKVKANPSGKKSANVLKWLNSARYRNGRKRFLKGRWCVDCLHNDDVLTPAVILDHIEPHRGDYDLFWDFNNWQGRCVSCHNRKTATHDGGFGND